MSTVCGGILCFALSAIGSSATHLSSFEGVHKFLFQNKKVTIKPSSSVATLCCCSNTAEAGAGAQVCNTDEK